MNGASPTAAPLALRAAWPPWLALGAGLGAVVLLYAPVVAGMAEEWAEFPSLSHGFAIPVIAAYLLWARRERLAAAPLTTSAWGLPIVMLTFGLLVVGSLGAEPLVARVSLPVALLGVTLLLAGPTVARLATPALAYLFFMVPLPYTTLKSLTYQSRLFDAWLTAEAVSALGVPVYRDGVMLHLANMTLEVADACSSVPAIAALVALGGAYAQMGPRPTWQRVVLIVAAAPLGLFSNIVRLVVTSLGAYYFGKIALENTIHKFNGTTVFLLTVVLLVVLDRALAWLAPRRGA